MIYFLDNSLQLQKIVTSKNIISAIHEHELNGLIRADVELDLSYVNKFLILGIDHVGYYYKDEFYLHKIQRVEYDHVNETATVVLRHIFFEDMIFGKLIRDVRPQNQDALTVSRQTIDANTRWQTIMTDVTGRLSTNFYWQVPYEVIEFMTENYRIEYLPKVLFDGKKINGFQLHLANKVGEDKNIRIPYGSRVLDLKYEEDYSEIITKLVVHGKGEEVGDGYGRRINISDVNFSRNGVKSPVGSLYLEDKTITNTYGNDGQTPREGREVFEDIEDANELAEAGYQHYLQVSRPQMLFTADVADIGDVGIGDSVMIIRREYDVYFNARIHKLSVDLLYPEDAQVELGDYKHFKESKIARKSREKNNRVQGQLSDRITRLKQEANDRFDNEVAQWKSEYDQALIDVHAEIEADRENMTNLIEGTRTEFTDNLNAEITQTKEYAEQQSQEKADSVQTNLESFKDSHQQLYEEVTGNILDIDTFLGDKSKTLKQQFDTVRTDFGTLQTDLDGVESDLTTTKTDLQNQLDDARKALDELEIGGRNLLPAFTSDKWTHQNLTEIEDYSLYIPPGTAGNSILFMDVEEHTNYTMTFNSDYARYYIYEVLEDESLGSIIRTRTGSETYTFNTEDVSRIRVSLNTFSGNVQEEKNIWNLKLEKGTVATDWTPALEDTEHKITTLNQQIEFIDGQLSAKLEHTDIEPINNKITEYGNSLTANAQSIESLISKTELHDGDITKWSNQTTANAESITSALSRISNTESGLTKAQTDITANADGLSALVTRVNKTETGIESLTTDFSIEAGKVETLISKTDGHTTQLANIVANYDGIEQTVAANDEWLGTHGSNVLQTVEGFEQKVWQSDIHNPNTMSFSDVTKEGNRNMWSSLGTISHLSSEGFIRMFGSPNNLLSLISPDVNLIEGETYTLTFESLIGTPYNLNELDQTFVVYPSATNQRLNENFVKRVIGSANDVNIYRYTVSFVARETTSSAKIYFGASPISPGQRMDIFIRKPKVELGTRSTPYENAFSILTQRADELKIAVSDGDGLASVIALSPTAIDLISDKINVTGNVNIKGGVTALAVDAIEGNFSRLFASSLTTNVIKSNHIQTDTALAKKFFATNANIDELITKTHFVNEMHALTLNVVDLNASQIRTKLLSANTIEADWLKSGTALLDKVFASTAMFERMMAKSAFVTTLSTVTLDLHELTIWRPDGVAFVRNGMERFGHPVPLTQYMGSTVSWTGQRYETGSRGSSVFAIAPGEHAGRYYNLVVGLGLKYNSQSASSHIDVVIRVQNKPNGVNWPTHWRYQFTVDKVETNWQTINVPLGRPTYGSFLFTIEFNRVGEAHHDNVVELRTGRSWVSA